jgi:hypothetical protein
MQDGDERIRLSDQQPLQFATLGEVEGCQPLIAVGIVQLGDEVSQPRSGPSAIFARADDVTEKDESGQLLHV